MLRKVDFLASDVPGVPVPVYLAGAKVRVQYAFGQSPAIGHPVLELNELPFPHRRQTMDIRQRVGVIGRQKLLTHYGLSPPSAANSRSPHRRYPVA